MCFWTKWNKTNENKKINWNKYQSEWKHFSNTHNRSVNGCPTSATVQPSVKKAKLEDATMIYPKGYSGKRKRQCVQATRTHYGAHIFDLNDSIFCLKKNFFKFPVYIHTNTLIRFFTHSFLDILYAPKNPKWVFRAFCNRLFFSFFSFFFLKY